MPDTYNIYCDESCHLENDHQSVMVLGALTCRDTEMRSVALAVRALKRKHDLDDSFEIKWSKVSPSKADFYIEVMDLFFATGALSFRGLVVPNKSALRHADFGQTHDEWYYKMYYHLLCPALGAKVKSRVFLDIKDTCGGPKIAKLESYLRSHLKDQVREMLLGMQLVHSKEVVLIQLADLLIGALSYVHRDLKSSPSKLQIIDRIRENTRLTLKWSTAPGRPKFDVFVWEANVGDT